MTIPAPASAALRSTPTKPTHTKPTLAALPLPASLAPKPANDPPGAGTLHLSNPARATFATQRASYPLKFLVPAPLPAQPPNVGLVYAIAYGGGLVAGDHVRMDVRVDAGCTLAMLTQGSTKIYKHRPGMRPHAHRLRHEREEEGFGVAGLEAPLTRQRMRVSVAPGAVLLLLPDSVSPFRDSRYAQVQRVLLAEGASALVLDWVNSGRGQRPPQPTRVTARGRWGKWTDLKAQHGRGSESESESEPGSRDGTDTDAETGTKADKTTDGVADTEVWAMGYYASINEIALPSPTGRAGPTIIARERMVLDNSGHDTRTQSTILSPTAGRLAPYHVYATVLVYGPTFAPLRALLEGMGDRASQFQLPRPPGLIWSYSPLDERAGGGGILRVAGVEVEDVRTWIREVLDGGGVKGLVGEALWGRCI